MKSLSFILVLIIIATISAHAQTVYTWDGSTSDVFTASSNWSPNRMLSLPGDVLVFNNTGALEITDVPSQMLGGIKLYNNSQITLSSSTVNKSIIISPTAGTEVIIDESSSLTFKNNGGVKIDVEMGANTSLEVGGSIEMEKGVFDFKNATVNLHTSTTPLVGTGGQFTFGSMSTLIFGKEGKTPAGQIVFGDDIFVGSQTIERLELNSDDGVQLGNQSFTINEKIVFSNGNLVTNSLGKIIFSTSAEEPVETSSSKIDGFAEMVARLVGVDGVSFLGYTIAPGIDDLGAVSILKMTGPAGVNFNNDSESIAVTWDVTVQNQPVNGRDVTMQWYSEFDNGNDIGLPMQMYRYTDGTAWEVVGGATAIASDVDGLRTSATILTTHFSQWTISSTDNALPVSLISFEGTAQSGSVALNWATASELNNDRFIIEKMDQGEFTYMGSVEGNGTSVEINNYNFVDDQPANGNNYYRLVQQDFDGKLTVHETITVEFAKSITGFEIYPNPSTGNSLNINFENMTGERAAVKIFDANGTLIVNKQVASVFKADLLEGKELSRGLYYLEFTDNENSSKKRLIVR